MKINFHKNIMKPVILNGLFSMLFILFGSATAWAQNNTVNGTVTDAQTGDPLAGVNILVVGTSTGGITNTDGHYSINVPSLQDTLRFSFIGYKTQAIPISGRTKIDVSLKTQVVSGQQVVVVGFGTQKQENLSTSVSTISSSQLGNAPVSQTLKSMQGKLSGVSIRQTSGVPGAGMRLRIRGAASISTSSAPLYVVDGQPINGNIDFLSSDQIKNISVLKGAAATALYGSRASNGVVLVQTKTAQLNETPTLTFNTNIGVQRIPDGRNIKVMNAPEFAAYQKYIQEVNGRPVPSYIQDPASWKGRGTNWQRVLERKAIMQRYNLNMGIGGDNFSTSVMAGFLNQKGVIKGGGYKRYSLRINTDLQPIDNLDIKLSVAPTYEDNTAHYEGGNRGIGLGLARLITPLIGPYNPDGTLREGISDSLSFADGNPLLQIKQRKFYNRDLTLLGNGSVSYDVTKGLTLKEEGNIQLNRHRGFFFHPTSRGAFNTFPPNVPSSETTYGNLYNWRTASSLTYEKSIGKNNIHFVGLFIAQKQKSIGNTINATQYPVSNEIKTINVAGNITVSNTAYPNTVYGSYTLLSYVGKLNYNYAQKYLLQLSLRRDGSSRFGPTNRFGYFPAASAGWVISNEKFWSVKPISLLKLRGSYGFTGNFNIGNYSFLKRIGTGFYAFNSNKLSQARYVANLSDEGLGWEKNKEYDIGLDVSFLNNRVKLNYDYYHKITTDLLYNISVPTSSGFSNLQTNIGSIKFWGHELSVTSENIRSSNWSWNTSVNVSFPRNKVLSIGTSNGVLYSGSGDLLRGSNITMVGKPLGMLYGMVYEGIYENEEQLKNLPTFDKSIVGSAKFKDTNGDGKLSAADATIIGNPRPKAIFGMTNNISYKNVSLSFVLSGSAGGSVLDQYMQGLLNLDGVFNVLKSVKYQYRGPDHPGKGQWGGSQSGNTNLVRDYNNTAMIENTTHLNIENITLGYNMLFHSNSVKNLEMYISVQNVLFFSHLRTKMAGVSTQTGDTDLGVIRYPYPVPRIFSFGINLKL
jgi:TonB-linked SusC/RagA family outer membrane protein